jgi:hypothetical protein
MYTVLVSHGKKQQMDEDRTREGVCSKFRNYPGNNQSNQGISKP